MLAANSTNKNDNDTTIWNVCEYSSPFFDIKNDDSNELSEKIKSLFPSRKVHIDTLLKLYKFIFSGNKKAIWEKTEEELKDDILNTSYSLDISKILEQHLLEIKQFEKQKENFNKRLSAIPVFIDFAYLFYVQHYDVSAPVYKLPAYLNKYKMITYCLKAPINDDLYACFEQCIENNFLSELRVENPPFYLTTDLSEKEIKEKIELIVKPLCKDILTQLLKMYQKETGVNFSPQLSLENIEIKTREDNLS
jgi:hypothetical protein